MQFELTILDKGGQYQTLEKNRIKQKMAVAVLTKLNYGQPKPSSFWRFPVRFP